MAADREIPMDFANLEEIAASRMASAHHFGPLERLMQAAPGETLGSPEIDKREAVIDCIDMLPEQDKFILEAIIYEGLNYRMLRRKNGNINSPCMETLSRCTRQSEAVIII